MKKNTDADDVAQAERVDRKARDLVEAFLDGRAGLVIEPLEFHEVGETPSLHRGFRIRIEPAK